MAGLGTPAGLYAITDKQVNPAWHVPNARGPARSPARSSPAARRQPAASARWMGIANGVGIHGTGEDWSIGSRASHGCIRMHVADVDRPVSARAGRHAGADPLSPRRPTSCCSSPTSSARRSTGRTEPGWLDALMPNDAELRRTGMTFTSAFVATACARRAARAPHRQYPSRHGVTLTLTDGDLLPDAAHACPTCVRARRRARPTRATARRAPAAQLRRGLLRARAQERRASPSCRRRRRPWPRCCASRLPRRAQGQVAPDQAGRRRRVGPRPTRARIERDYGFADWEPPDAGGDAKAEHFGGGNAGPQRRRAGTRTTRARWRPGSPAPTCPSRSAWSSRSSTRTTCSATRARTSAAATRAASSTTSASRCRRRSTRTCATSRPCRR